MPPFIVSYILRYFIFYKQFYLILSRIFTKNIKNAISVTKWKSNSANY